MTLVALIGRELTFPATDTGTTSAEEGRQGLVIVIIIKEGNESVWETYWMLACSWVNSSFAKSSR